MKNKIIVAIIALVALLGLFLIIKSVSAKTIEPEECCKVEDTEITSDETITTSSRRSSGGYMWQAPKGTKAGTKEEWIAFQKMIGAIETGIFDFQTYQLVIKYNASK